MKSGFIIRACFVLSLSSFIVVSFYRFFAVENSVDITPVNVAVTADSNSFKGVRVGNITYYPHNICYFHVTGQGFVEELSRLIDAHTNLEVTAMTGDVVRKRGKGLTFDGDGSNFGDYGCTVGYFVTFREKEIRAEK